MVRHVGERSGRQGTEGWGRDGVLGKSCWCDCWERKRSRMNRKWWEVARLWGFDIHLKEFRLYSVANAFPCEGF